MQEAGNKLGGDFGEVVSLQEQTLFSAEGEVKMYRSYRQI